jgi:hypothetical protein
VIGKKGTSCVTRRHIEADCREYVIGRLTGWEEVRSILGIVMATIYFSYILVSVFRRL